MHDPDPKCRPFGILWHFGIFDRKGGGGVLVWFMVSKFFLRNSEKNLSNLVFFQGKNVSFSTQIWARL